MSWLKKLHETYDKCFFAKEMSSKKSNIERLLPICHSTQNAQIEVVIDGTGKFLRASVISKNEAATIIPCTEESGGRAGSKPTSHPLCDKLQYLAGDFLKFGGQVTSGFAKEPEAPHKQYLDHLSKWCASKHCHPKIEAIYSYIKQASLVTDLCDFGTLHKDPATGLLLKAWTDASSQVPPIFGVMSNKAPPEEAFIRWIVEIPGENPSALSTDKSVWQSWIAFYTESIKDLRNLCFATGETLPIAKQHPAKIMHAGDKAKLISSNDNSGFTFRGRFTDSEQVCGVGLEVTHKAHNTLRWLIKRQGYQYGSQAIVAWSVEAKEIPKPLISSLDLFDEEFPETKMEQSESSIVKVAQDFALRLKRKLEGYKAELGKSTSIVVLALDSATPGRMSVTYYRELTASEFLSRIEAWHQECCWFQNFGKEMRFVGAPAPKDIAEAAFGRRLDDKLRNATVRQLLPCIMDAAPLPLSLVRNCVQRASNRNGLEPWEWEKVLGIACALYRKHKLNKRIYQMSLELECTSRDYLYGRLLAIAENLERMALYIARENRPTNAERLMQQFSDNPYSTWLILEKALKPYEMRLRGQRAGFLHNMQILMDGVMAAFVREEFISPSKLSGEFLLGYHCQRAALRPKSAEKNEENEETNENN